MIDRSELLDVLDELPEAGRIRSRKVAGSVATIVADATGLNAKEAAELEQRLRTAAEAQPGISEARIAMTAAQPQRKLIAIASINSRHQRLDQILVGFSP